MIHEPLGSVVVICEGQGDDSFVRHLVRRRNLGNISTAYPSASPGGRSGFTELLRALRLHTNFGGVNKVIVVSDNDTDCDASFVEVQRLIGSAGGYLVPPTPLAWTATRAGISVAIVMLPETGETGDLEILCLRAAKEQWPQIYDCVEGYVRCTSREMLAVNKLSKLMLRCLLSAVCVTDPNTSLVHLWSRGAPYEIDLTNPAFDALAMFLAAAAA
ncbi:MAG: DUF3226 domain-containing protein [Gemmatimonadaceae bacterium]